MGVSLGIRGWKLEIFVEVVVFIVQTDKKKDCQEREGEGKKRKNFKSCSVCSIVFIVTAVVVVSVVAVVL